MAMQCYVFFWLLLWCRIFMFVLFHYYLFLCHLPFAPLPLPLAFPSFPSLPLVSDFPFFSPSSSHFPSWHVTPPPANFTITMVMPMTKMAAGNCLIPASHARIRRKERQRWWRRRRRRRRRSSSIGGWISEGKGKATLRNERITESRRKCLRGESKGKMECQDK